MSGQVKQDRRGREDGRRPGRQLGRRIRVPVVAQFGRPTGVWGCWAGLVMAYRPSNRRRNAWAVSLLEVQPGDRVLEVGFGPGLAVRRLTGLARRGRVCGIDHSELMLRQARRRNAAAIRRGLVDLRVAAVESLPPFGTRFDKVLAVNTMLFWTDPQTELAELRRVLRPGGVIAVVHQPREPGATDATTTAKGREIAAVLARAGLRPVRTETLRISPAVVCVLAVNGTDA